MIAKATDLFLAVLVIAGKFATIALVAWFLFSMVDDIRDGYNARLDRIDAQQAEILVQLDHIDSHYRGVEPTPTEAP